jgi:hypothetical protein
MSSYVYIGGLSACKITCYNITMIFINHSTYKFEGVKDCNYSEVHVQLLLLKR